MELRRIESSPPGQSFWEGAWRVPGDPGATIPYFICCSDEAAPSAEQLAFCRRIESIVDACLERARVFVLREMAASPTMFGLSDDDASELARGAGDALAFGGPELTFYGGEAWFVRFTETRSSGCELGLGVDFEGVSPVHASCLDREDPLGSE